MNNGLATIDALAEPGEFQDPCGYALGYYFLIHLYEAMGLAAFSSAMRGLHERYPDHRFHPTEEHVYHIFLSYTPPDREATFREVYRRLHSPLLRKVQVTWRLLTLLSGWQDHLLERARDPV